MKHNKLQFLLLASCFVFQFSCSKSTDSPSNIPAPVTPPITVKSDVDSWLTNGSQSALLQKQTTVLTFGSVANNYLNIEVDTTARFQTIDGFGYTLTGGSATVINLMSPAAKNTLLQELFGLGDGSIKVSYLRISIGASDLNASPFTYNDLPAGQTDLNLSSFSLSPDKTDLIPLLKEIVAINPNIKIMATPWSPPVWLKDNGKFVGGSLKAEYYGVYAEYFVKYIQMMKAEGIVIDAITPQNEPLNPNNNPSLLMTAVQQTDFIKNNLGPAFQVAGIATKIVCYDHNCDDTNYAITVLSDAKAKSFVNGSAFHLYAGNISALTIVHNASPDKQVYFTEQYTDSKGDFGGDLKWHLKNVIIGATRNWSRNALEWNLANDTNFGPHTMGGCTTCKGALTISGSNVSRNVSYYIIAHASKFVPAGSVRIGSNVSGSLQTVAFQIPNGKKVLIAENDGSDALTFNIKFNGKWTTTQLNGGSVATYVW